MAFVGEHIDERECYGCVISNSSDRSFAGRPWRGGGTGRRGWGDGQQGVSPGPDIVGGFSRRPYGWVEERSQVVAFVQQDRRYYSAKKPRKCRKQVLAKLLLVNRLPSYCLSENSGTKHA